MGGAALEMVGGGTGNGNVAIGNVSQQFTTTGCSGTSVGFQSLYRLTSGFANTAFGMSAGCGITTGYNNTIMGQNAGCALTTGQANTYIGQASGKEATTGNNNTAVGINAIRLAGSSCDNVAVGIQTLSGAGMGNCNTMIGSYAGNNGVLGSNNTALGWNAGAVYCTMAGQSNWIVIGNQNNTNAFIQIAWTVTSDERKKKIKGPVPLALDFVNALEPIEYQFIDEETQEVKDEIYRYGFSAQKVKALEADPENPVIVTGSDERGYSLTTDYMMPTLVNAIQELSTELKELKAKIATLEGKN
jgi:hypothetical protein